MTVGEMIEALKALNPSHTILVNGVEADGETTWFAIESVSDVNETEPVFVYTGKAVMS